MTDYLKQFIDRATDVPMQLRRRLALIRDLDEKAGTLHGELDGHCKRLLAERVQQGKKQKVAAPEDAHPPYDVESALKRLLGLADEKVNIANQIYDFMDRHINQLDSELQQLDAEIEADRQELGLEGDETACERLGVDAPKGAHPPSLGGTGEPQKKKRGRKKEEPEAARGAASMAPLENEPAYCICNKPSAGNMVGCDNPDCTIEWFHYECVGLKEAPQGQWFCPICRGEQRPGKKQGKKA